MPLNKNLLGTELYNSRSAFNDKTIDELIRIYGSLEGVRLAMAKADAETFINHFINNITVSIPGAGLIAPSGGGPVTGKAITGTIL